MCCNEDDWRVVESLLGVESSLCELAGSGTIGAKGGPDHQLLTKDPEMKCLTSRASCEGYTQIQDCIDLLCNLGTLFYPHFLRWRRGCKWLFQFNVDTKTGNKPLFSSCQSRCSVCSTYWQFISILQVSVKAGEHPESLSLWSGTNPCPSVPLAWR